MPVPVQVEYYGAMTPLKSMANASTPDAQTIAIQPFDKTCARCVRNGCCTHSTPRAQQAHVHTPHGAAVVFLARCFHARNERADADPHAAPLFCAHPLSSAIKDIERALMTSDLGLTPSNDGNIIRLTIPQLTQDRRKELTKLVGKLTEEGKVALRNVRRDALKALDKLEKDKALSEDQLTAAKDAMQKVTDGCAPALSHARACACVCSHALRC
jgi:ribosome recycling factor